MRDTRIQLDPLETDPQRPVILARKSSGSSDSTVPDKEKQLPWTTEYDETGLERPRTDTLDTSPLETNHGEGTELHKPQTKEVFNGFLKLRSRDDDDPIDWWFASTAIPLIAATFAPMANMLSIAALVVFWRNNLSTDDPITKYDTSVGFRDPPWCLDLNGASLACGFIGNIFLLFNMTKKIRYIIALPLTILFFFMASGILIGIIVAMEVYAPPGPNQVYSQGYWHAVIAACLYMLNAGLLMINMLGYFLGHYPQHFDLNDEQRNLILQTMIFFVWLAGGAGVFARLEPDWGYPDALYFCDVTLLTIGFGDFFATNDTARGLVFPYSVGGTIILGLMVSSIHKFAQEISKDKVVRNHIETRRVNTLSRAITPDDNPAPPFNPSSPFRPSISSPLESAQIQRDLDQRALRERAMNRTINFQDARREDYMTPISPGARTATATEDDNTEPSPLQFRFSRNPNNKITLRSLTLEPLQRVASIRHHIPPLLPNRSQKAILMASEKDRFDRMRAIQISARRFKKWYALTISIICFGLLWCMGALVFHFAEWETQRLTYFQGLYFCYVSLLTIGYGDLSPKSNGGKAFFVVWSLVAVPTMTILVSDLGDTVIGGFKRRTLEYGSLFFLGKDQGWGLDWFLAKKEQIRRKLSSAGIGHEKAPKLETGEVRRRSTDEARELDDDESEEDERQRKRQPRTINDLANDDLSEAEMMRGLAHAIRRVADDMRHTPKKEYSYEEWVEFTRLVRFTKLDRKIADSPNPAVQLEYDEALDGIIEWDWLDKNSPMISEQTETEWLMDRLLESLLRLFKRKDLLRASGLHEQHIERHHRRPSSMSISAARRYSAVDGWEDITSAAAIDGERRRSSAVENADDSPKLAAQPQWSKRGLVKKEARSTLRTQTRHRPHIHHKGSHHGSGAVTFQRHHSKARTGRPVEQEETSKQEDQNGPVTIVDEDGPTASPSNTFSAGWADSSTKSSPFTPKEATTSAPQEEAPS